MSWARRIVVAKAELLALTRNTDSTATSSSSRAGGTTNANGLASLKRRDPVDRPSSNHRIDRPARCPEEVLILADRKFVSATEVKDLADIEVGQTPIKHRTESGHGGCAKSTYASAVQQVTRIRERLRVSVGEKEGETVRVLLFEFRLQAIVVALPNGCLVTPP